MELKEFFLQYPRAKRNKVRETLAKGLNVSRSAVALWENKHRLPRPQHAILLEEMTEGKVTRTELRPDIFDEKYIENNILKSSE